MSDNNEQFRKRFSITAEQNLLLQNEAERLGKTDSVVLKEIINLGFSEYISRLEIEQETAEIGHTDTPQIDNEKLEEVLRYARQAAALSYGMLAAFFYIEPELLTAQELLIKQIVNYDDKDFKRSKLIVGSESAAIAFMFQKIGGYMSENGGDMMNAYYRFCETYNVDPRIVFNRKMDKWESYKNPEKQRPLFEDKEHPAFRPDEIWSPAVRKD